MTFIDIGDGPPLLFLHGVGMSAGAYRPLLRRLAKRWRVIAPDLPGAGGTPLPAGVPTLDGFAGRIAQLLRERGVRPAVAVGHSLGGGVALSMAASGVPLERLVLINSVGAGVPLSNLAFLYRFFLLKNLQVVVSPTMWPAVWRVLPGFVANFFRHPLSYRPLGKLALRAARERHPGLAAPSRFAFVTSRSDVLFPPQLFRDLVPQVPNSRVVEVRGGHDWPIIHPEEASAVIATILAD